MAYKRDSADFLEYLAADQNHDGEDDANRLPPLNAISKEMGVSISSLREQLEVARALGLVEVRPRTGIRRLPYSFTPAVRESLLYAIALDRAHFDAFSDLRKHLEQAYWQGAVELLTPQDHQALRDLVEQAWEKLHGSPIQIPHREHRELHLLIFRRLNNPFVLGVLGAYWDAYEEVGLNLYEGLSYLESVWDYHRQMVEAICAGEFETGYRLLVDHMELIHRRSD